jgi:phosphopentomutase
VQRPLALTGRLATLSAGKDTTVGHWEHMGLVTERPFPTYPHGFPEDVLGPFRERIGRGVLGNRTASGTVIIEELGAEHVASGWPIVYTSADSVFQIAAHVEVVPLESLYEWCEIARGILQGPHGVARVIARPFTGSPGAFTRTKDRRDFSLAPPGPTYLDLLHEAGVPVLALGKIGEVFTGRGITGSLKVASNDDNLTLVRDLLERHSDKATFDEGLLFTNLVDFDMVWGHRNEADGFAAGLQALDVALPGIVEALEPGDSLLISADHGVDPTTLSTDHRREYVPLLLYPRPRDCPSAVYEGTLADTGATVFATLTETAPGLGGDALTDLRPSRGWR